MSSNFAIVAGQVAILFALISIGFACRKSRMLTDQTIGGLVSLLLNVVSPCVIVQAFNRPFEPTILRGFLIAVALGVALHLTLILVVRFVFRTGAENSCVVLKNATVFSNSGFMGIPLEYAILGSEGVFYGIAYIVVFNLFAWSWGLGLNMDGRFRLSWRMVLNPGMYGLVAGFAVFLLPWKLPSIVAEPIEMVAAMNTPLAMMVVGSYLVTARFGRILKLPSAHLAATIRLVLAPLAVVGVLWLFRGTLDRTMMLAVVIPAAAPVGATTAMFAAMFRRDIDLAAALVSGTTLVSILTMPFIIAAAMALFP